MDTPFRLDPAQDSYLQKQLENVSRSFALVVPFLESPLRQYLATTYLLCRVVDNIEDCWQPVHWKEQRFREFEQLLREPARAVELLGAWQREEWQGLTALEQALMTVETGGALWQIYGAIPDAPRAIIRRWTHEMSQGMWLVTDPAKRPNFVNERGIQVLECPSDYDEYCYYVAGTVGHLATELVIGHYRLTDDVAHVLRAGAEACGRALQKTNILKDFAEDLERKVCYLPAEWLSRVNYAPLALRGAAQQWTAEVIGNILDELRNATDYLLALPYSARGYRQSSLLCLLPAYETIRLAAQRREELFTARHQIKISRLTMARCLTDSHTMLLDNPAVHAYSRRVEQEILSRTFAAAALEA